MMTTAPLRPGYVPLLGDKPYDVIADGAATCTVYAAVGELSFTVAVSKADCTYLTPSDRKQRWLLETQLASVTSNRLPLPTDEPMIKVSFNGREELCAIVRVEPDGVSCRRPTGIVKIPFQDLPEEVRKQYGYDWDAARAYAKRMAVEQARFLDQAEQGKWLQIAIDDSGLHHKPNPTTIPYGRNWYFKQGGNYANRDDRMFSTPWYADSFHGDHFGPDDDGVIDPSKIRVWGGGDFTPLIKGSFGQ